jgi:S-formylglutathione hydrolase FrmB
MQPTERAHGRFEQHTVSSPALRGNPLEDPAERPLWIYLPPAYDTEPERRFPVIYVIQGMTGRVGMWWNITAFRPTYPDLVEDVFSGSDAPPPALVVLVDAFTSYGGSQFLNSPGTGRYLDYLCDDVVGYVDAKFRTRPDRDSRALTGKSSGGYGAMVVPMLRPDVFGSLASHAGDALFDFCYLPEFPVVVRALRDHYDGSYEKFWADFRSRVAWTRPNDEQLVNTYCMAACYSAEPDGSVTLPFDPRTGRLREEVWARWLEVDPVRMAARHAEALRSMHAIFLDAGRSDEFFLDVGAQAFAAELDKLGVSYRLDLFDAGHGRIEWRYPLALRYLAERFPASTG